jgi:CRISPR/Cas system-associated exonuclease Cas4 (RecB family)
MNEPIFSASSLASYLTCPARYYQDHVLRLPQAQNVSAAVGTATHSGIEALHHGKGPQAAHVAVIASWEKEAALIPPADLAEDPAALPDALKMLAVYEKKVLPDFHPDLIEQEFTIRVFGVLVTGTIDAADTKTDTVHDTKTTASARFKPDSHRLQLSIYAAGYQSITGRWPVKLGLDVLWRAGKVKHYDVTPDYGEMQTVIETVRDGIGRGDFSPTGAAAGKCQFCPYRLICSSSTYQRETA